MCRLLKVPRSSFYAWRHHVDSAGTVRRARLAQLVAAAFDGHQGRAGCRRLTVDLNEAGEPCSVGLVHAIMSDLGLKAVQPRAYRRTTWHGEDPFPVPDLIGRDFTADTGAPGRRLVGDITYLRTGQGWLYLATVIDLTTRMVVGWQLADHMRTSLVTDALAMAIRAGHVETDAIFHSDRGTQYTSSEFAEFCRQTNVRRSMGRTGVCWDNAVAESWFATLKNEMYYLHAFPTRALARMKVAEYIEVYYNRKRRHSSLGYRAPYKAFTDHLAAAAA